MDMKEILELVQPEWREEFLSFVTTGEATPAFLEFLENDPDCDRAADLAMDCLIQSLAEVGNGRESRQQCNQR
jgi:hypothetical protein